VTGGMAALAVAATALALPVRASAGARLPRRRQQRRASSVGDRTLALVFVGGALAVAVSLGVTTAVIAGLAVTALVVRRRRTEARSASSSPAAETPLLLDLVAACLDVGLPLPAALDAAAAVASPTLAADVRAAVGSLRGLVDPDDGWAALLADQRWAVAARLCRRADVSGAAVVAELRRLAARQRATSRQVRRRDAQRASIWVVLPLGLCFLPAFILLAVVPLVATLLPSLR
jgi:Type II secretion system (T2SS), protein F